MKLKKTIEVEAHIGDEIFIPEGRWSQDGPLYIQHIDGDTIYFAPYPLQRNTIKPLPKDQCDQAYSEYCHLVN